MGMSWEQGGSGAGRARHLGEQEQRAARAWAGPTLGRLGRGRGSVPAPGSILTALLSAELCPGRLNLLGWS